MVPVYGCASCLGALHQRLASVLGALGVAYEIIFVDDRSPDEAWSVLQQFARSDRRVRALRLSRNFGQHAAITAGLAHAAGSWVVVMDCDLQDPPEHIPELYTHAREGGFEIVYARRVARHHSLVRRWSARLYFSLLGFLAGIKYRGEYGTFSIVSRKVVDAFLELNDADRHYLFILNWLGFSSTSIDVEQDARFAGRSAYTPRKLIAHAFGGIMFQTTLLLRWIVYAGFVIALAGVLLAAFFVISWIARDPYPGWTSLAVLVLVLSGFIILSLGVTGLYVGQIFGQVKGRPLYIIDEELYPAGAANLRTDDELGQRVASQR